MAWEALPIELGEIIFQHATDSDLHMITSFSTVSKEFNAWNNLCLRLENCEETIQNFDFLHYDTCPNSNVGTSKQRLKCTMKSVFKGVVTTTIAWMIAAKNLAFTLSESTKLK